ncbi:MAG TPA: GNAT family N-acetyltransferase [Acidimicrobiales bacterium]|nr:GNAT family N-acetyltransferase [Acidimicrobiales bacterium]
MITTLDTDRLRLRPIALADADLLVELDSDPEVMRYLTGRPSTREEVLATVAERSGWRWVATERTGDTFVGWFGLVPSQDGTYDVGYRLRREWWCRGLATEGTRALIDAAFESLGARRVTAQTMAVNRRSRAVMERCGLQLERTFHLQWDDPLPGSEEGEVEYALGRQSWEAQRREPEERDDSRQVTFRTAEVGL